MNTEQHVPKGDAPAYFTCFCSPASEGWRVHVIHRSLPDHLRPCFDRGQAYPVQLAFDELDRQMHAKSLDYERHLSTVGGVELTACGAAAGVLLDWLSSMFTSGLRSEAGYTRGAARENGER